MEFIKKLLGIKSLETKLKLNTKKIKTLEQRKPKTKTIQITKIIQPPKAPTPKTQPTQTTKILQLLKTPTSTSQVAKKLKITRSRASQLLNKLEKLGKVIEHSKSGKTILYKIK